MKKLKFTKLIVSLCLLTVSTAIEAQLLKGNIKADSIESMQIAYTPDGNLLNMMYLDIEPDENGNFSWDAELTDPTNDISIYVDNYIFGACVEKGKTINIRLEQNRKSKKFDVKFEGDNASVSNFYNAYTQAFDIMKYFSPDPEESKTTEEYREILEKEYATLKKKLSAIKKEKQYDYYAKLSEGMYTWTRLRIIMDQAENEDKSWKMYPEYLEIVKSIDPNDPDNIRTNLIYSWLGGQQKIDNDFNNDMTDYFDIVVK